MRSEYKQPVSNCYNSVWALYKVGLFISTFLRDVQLGSSTTWRSELRERSLWRDLKEETGVQK